MQIEIVFAYLRGSYTTASCRAKESPLAVVWQAYTIDLLWCIA